MTLKQKYFFFLFTFSLLIPVGFAKADNATSATTSIITGSVLGTSTATSTLQAPMVPPIIAAIEQGKQLLDSVVLNHALTPVYKKNTAKLLRYQLGDKDIALAILDPSTNSTMVTIGRQAPNNTMVFPDPAVSVKLIKFNGVNSQFEVDQPAGGTVVALKYLLSSKASGSQKTIEAGLSPVVYVPYSDQLNSPDVIAYGQDYLNEVIQQAVNQLKYLPSHALPGQQLTDAIPPSLIKALIYAEHTDTATVMDGNAQAALNQLNIIFAANQGDAYKYSVSSDGFSSRGIAQFVKSTYDSLVKRHPEAGLIPDFVTGMADHVNSVKAMYLLVDDYAGDVRAKAPDGFVASRVFDYGAASYNAGTTRVAKAVENFGDNWNMDRGTQSAGLQADINSLTAQVKSLKSQISKTKDKTAKADLQSQLDNAQSQLSGDTSTLKKIKTYTLTNTTINYLTKIYKVITQLNSEQQVS